MLLNESLKKTISIVDGFKIGYTVIEDDKACIVIKNEMIELTEDDHIELLNGDRYERVTYEDLLTLKTDEGWPLLAGFDARVKFA